MTMPRPLSAVPLPIRCLPAVALALQLLLSAWLPAPGVRREPLPPAPKADWLRVASLGEMEVASRLLMLQIQGFDDTPGTRWRDLDYAVLAAWLDRALDLDPRGQAPLLAAVDVYGAVNDPARLRIMLDFVYRRFAGDPSHRWPWLAHAALLARHRLHDPQLAQHYAQAIRLRATGPDVPPWARELDTVLAQSSAAEGARVLAGGLLASGLVRDSGQLRWLERRLPAPPQQISSHPEHTP
jgi:hypothetical protein